VLGFVSEPSTPKGEVQLLVAFYPGDELLRIEPAVVGRDEALDAADVFVVPDLLEMLAENCL
jgi:hypothetical protein